MSVNVKRSKNEAFVVQVIMSACALRACVLSDDTSRPQDRKCAKDNTLLKRLRLVLAKVSLNVSCTCNGLACHSACIKMPSLNGRSDVIFVSYGIPYLLLFDGNERKLLYW